MGLTALSTVLVLHFPKQSANASVEKLKKQWKKFIYEQKLTWHIKVCWETLYTQPVWMLGWASGQAPYHFSSHHFHIADRCNQHFPKKQVIFQHHGHHSPHTGCAILERMRAYSILFCKNIIPTSVYFPDTELANCNRVGERWLHKKMISEISCLTDVR